LMDSHDSVTGPINLGNPVETTVRELAQIVTEIVGTSSEVLYRDLPTDDPLRRKPDITRAQAILDWSPTTDLRSGIRAVVDHFANSGLAPRQRRPSLPSAVA